MKYLIALYQLNQDAELREHLENKIYENVQKEYPTKASLLRFYKPGYEFMVETDKLPTAFLKELLHTPYKFLGEDFSGYRLGITDIVSICEAPKSLANWYYCDTYGWKEMN